MNTAQAAVWWLFFAFLTLIPFSRFPPFPRLCFCFSPLFLSFPFSILLCSFFYAFPFLCSFFFVLSLFFVSIVLFSSLFFPLFMGGLSRGENLKSPLSDPFRPSASLTPLISLLTHFCASPHNYPRDEQNAQRGVFLCVWEHIAVREEGNRGN